MSADDIKPASAKENGRVGGKLDLNTLGTKAARHGKNMGFHPPDQLGGVMR
jgi:hypothetical protein